MNRVAVASLLAVCLGCDQQPRQQPRPHSEKSRKQERLPESAGASGSPFIAHPAAAELDRVFQAQSSVAGFEASPITRRDYLKLIADVIDYWKNQQNATGAIIDPYERGERQYSTPAFALAAALLATADGRDDLLNPAMRAMTWATSSLAAGKAADRHSDFFMPMLIHARRLLKGKIPADTLADWDKNLKSIAPEKIYNMSLKGMNWNIVSSSGELLRRQDGLVASDQLDPQLAYLNDRLADHRQHFTDVGMYADPGVPLTYDEFSRLWRSRFHKVIAAAGGYYLEIDTAADPQYNATGLQRIHRSGVEFPPLSDSTVAHRDYEANDGAGETMSPGIQWKLRGSIDPGWESLGEAMLRDSKKPFEVQRGSVRDVQLKVDQVSPSGTKFSMTWAIISAGADRVVREEYSITPSGVQCVSSVAGDPAPVATRVLMPALVFDGVDKTAIQIDGKCATIAHRGSVLRWQIDSEASKLRLDGPSVPAHNGMMQALIADLPPAETKVRWGITLDQPH